MNAPHVFFKKSVRTSKVHSKQWPTNLDKGFLPVMPSPWKARCSPPSLSLHGSLWNAERATSRSLKPSAPGLKSPILPWCYLTQVNQVQCRKFLIRNLISVQGCVRTVAAVGEWRHVNTSKRPGCSSSIGSRASQGGLLKPSGYDFVSL